MDNNYESFEVLLNRIATIEQSLFGSNDSNYLANETNQLTLRLKALSNQTTSIYESAQELKCALEFSKKLKDQIKGSKFSNEERKSRIEELQASKESLERSTQTLIEIEKYSKVLNIDFSIGQDSLREALSRVNLKIEVLVSKTKEQEFQINCLIENYEVLMVFIAEMMSKWDRNLNFL